jgi:ABC-type multidrug transport system ATPase subunit
MVSTPYMDEASLCERIALIQNGKILTVNKPQEIVNQNNNKIFSVRSADNYSLLQSLRTRSDVASCYMFGDTLHLTFKENILPKNLPESIEIRQIEASIEDCFIELMETT